MSDQRINEHFRNEIVQNCTKCLCGKPVSFQDTTEHRMSLTNDGPIDLTSNAVMIGKCSGGHIVTITIGVPDFNLDKTPYAERLQASWGIK